jgi:NADH:ubiquinone oxidoreductase subunit F (NADH-binding)/NADH:ubiquinone oxidoreductase subunit E
MIVQRLREIQNRYGVLPEAELRKLARDAGVPLHRVEEISSFFPAFRLERSNPPEIEVKVCRDMTCHLRGSNALLEAEAGLPALAASLCRATGKSVSVEGVSCLGRCDRAPAVWAQRRPMPEGVHAWVYAGKTRAALEDVIRALANGQQPPKPDEDAAHETAINADWRIEVYGPRPRDRDYRALREFVADLKALRLRSIPRPPRRDGKELPGAELEQYVRTRHPKLWELEVSGLLGMGGAGMPAYGKWLDVWRERSNYEDDVPAGSPGPYEKYIVANGDESEPGTFKDRELLLRHPHLVVEGVILAGLLTGASAGYIFIRHEYHEQIHAVREEIARARSLDACGPDVFGSGREFSVEVFESPGGYICGEQSALLEAMEDRRAQPRNRPPELTTNGLRDRPTVVNNVETLAWVPAVLLSGGKAYADSGWAVPGGDERLRFSGRRLFSVSGDVRRPGVYEVPVGLPLGELIESPTYCGGLTSGLAAIATSGPSGGLLPARIPVDPALQAGFPRALEKIAERSPRGAAIMEWFLSTHIPAGAKELDLLTLPLDLAFFRNLHVVLRLPVEPMLGAGLVVYGRDTDILDQAVNFTRFYRNESCGKCVPCRIGSQKLVQIGTDLLDQRDAGKPPAGPDADGLRRDVAEITRALQLTSICGLGYVAPIPLATALAYFPDSVRGKSRTTE